MSKFIFIFFPFFAFAQSTKTVEDYFLYNLGGEGQETIFIWPFLTPATRQNLNENIKIYMFKASRECHSRWGWVYMETFYIPNKLEYCPGCALPNKKRTFSGKSLINDYFIVHCRIRYCEDPGYDYRSICQESKYNCRLFSVEIRTILECEVIDVIDFGEIISPGAYNWLRWRK